MRTCSHLLIGHGALSLGFGHFTKALGLSFVLFHFSGKLTYNSTNIKHSLTILFVVMVMVIVV